jgi:hypothetical protein
MVKLFLHVTRTAHTYEPGHRLLKNRVQKRFAKLRHLLACVGQKGVTSHFVH